MKVTHHKPIFINREYYPFICKFPYNLSRTLTGKGVKFKHHFYLKKSINYPIKKNWSVKTKLKFYYF